jgi:hypothetical protein
MTQPLPLVPNVYKVGWAQRSSLHPVVKRKSPCPCWESNPCHPAQNLVTILNELPQLLKAHALPTFSHCYKAMTINWNEEIMHYCPLHYQYDNNKVWKFKK